MIDAQPDRLLLARLDSPLGAIAVVTDEQDVLRGLWFDDVEESKSSRARRRLYGAAPLQSGTVPDEIRAALGDYFAGDLSALDAIRWGLAGTTFQRTVWTALTTIPAGATTSYGALAVSIGRPTAVRAVGAANGANPISIVIPCHRVLGADRTLTGYGGGLERKRWLLAHEGALPLPGVDSAERGRLRSPPRGGGIHGGR